MSDYPNLRTVPSELLEDKLDYMLTDWCEAVHQDRMTGEDLLREMETISYFLYLCEAHHARIVWNNRMDEIKHLINTDKLNTILDVTFK